MSAASATAVAGPSHPCTVRCGRTGTIKNGRPAFLKDNDTNHMLWFAHGADGPTWYVGKREEFGESRGWLQVKSDAQTPHEIKDPWSVWSVSERRWKEASEVKCIAVSATAGVIVSCWASKHLPEHIHAPPIWYPGSRCQSGLPASHGFHSPPNPSTILRPAATHASADSWPHSKQSAAGHVGRVSARAAPRDH